MRKNLILLIAVVVVMFMTTGVFADTSGDMDVPADENYEYTDEESGEIVPDEPEIPDGWNEDHTQYYADGEPVTGFFLVDEKLYYADEKGRVKKGSTILTVDGLRYIMEKDVILTGPRVVKFKGNYYYITGENGSLKQNAGFVNFEEKRYYVLDGGRIQTDKLFKVGDRKYLSSGNGSLRSGLIKWNGRYYYFNDNYAMRVNEGFVYANGNKYFNKKNGGIKTDAFVKWKKKYYFAGKNGAIKMKKFKYKKRTVRPNKKTGAISRYNYMVAIGKYKKSPYHYDKYILIDISSQRLTYYVHGRKKLRCKVVTGCVADGHSTPKGKYRIRRKARGVTLKGPGYSSYVEYWMPFIGNSYGMHDASWRSRFGGKIYKHNGSHGCVNMPRRAARRLYKKVRVGTIVIIRK